MLCYKALFEPKNVFIFKIIWKANIVEFLD
jgi:hypothetical protein